MSYVKSFYKNQLSNGYVTDLAYLFEHAANYSGNRLKDNYKDFKQDYIAASIIYDSEPIGFSLLQERDIFNGMARCLTRLFFPAPQSKSLMNKNYRYSDGLRPEIYQMLDQQLDMGRRLGFKDFFISREDIKPLIIKNIYDGMIKNGYDWRFEKEQCYVTETSKQWVLFKGENLLRKAFP